MVFLQTIGAYNLDGGAPIHWIATSQLVTALMLLLLETVDVIADTELQHRIDKKQMFHSAHLCQSGSQS